MEKKMSDAWWCSFCSQRVTCDSQAKSRVIRRLDLLIQHVQPARVLGRFSPHTELCVGHRAGSKPVPEDQRTALFRGHIDGLASVESEQ
jgi:hypothetical protein